MKDSSHPPPPSNLVQTTIPSYSFNGMASDDEEPFAYLYRRIPAWLNDLDAVSAETARRKSDLSVSGSTLVPIPPPPPPEPSIPDGANSLTVTHVLSERPLTSRSSGNRRFRSSDSISTSRPRFHQSRYRAQNNIIVFYDGPAQLLLATLHDDIVKARAMVRKTKARVRSRTLARPSLHELSTEPGSDDESLMAKMKLKRSMPSLNRWDAPSPLPSTTLPKNLPEMEALEQTDKHLDRAQDLCCTAAFQLLRDGDCRKQTRSAAARLESAWTITETEVVRMKAKAKREQSLLQSIPRSQSVIATANKGSAQPDWNSCGTEMRLSLEGDNDFLKTPVRFTTQLYE